MRSLVDFRHLCDLADVRGLNIEITVTARLRGAGNELRRDLAEIIVCRPDGQGAARQTIHRSIDAAARRLLEVIR